MGRKSTLVVEELDVTKLEVRLTSQKTITSELTPDSYHHTQSEPILVSPALEDRLEVPELLIRPFLRDVLFKLGQFEINQGGMSIVLLGMELSHDGPRLIDSPLGV